MDVYLKELRLNLFSSTPTHFTISSNRFRMKSELQTLLIFSRRLLLY